MSARSIRMRRRLPNVARPHLHLPSCIGADLITVDRLVHHGIYDFTPDAFICMCEMREAFLRLLARPSTTLVGIAEQLGMNVRSLSRWLP